MASFSANTLSLDHLCYVHCNICDTVLAVNVPCTSLFKTVTVRCGQCTNLLPVRVRGSIFPSENQFHHSFSSPSHLNPLEDMQAQSPNFLINQTTAGDLGVPERGVASSELPKPVPVVNRTPEKRQRVPSAYNRFIKEEIQRIKSVNPNISHREAFSAAAKNWAHFPHIHFGLMPDQRVKMANMRQKEGEDQILIKDGFFASTNVGVTPY